MVELSNRTCSEQHHGVRRMTSSPAFRAFAFAFGMAFGVLYPIVVKLDLALFTVYPVIGVVLPGTHHSGDVNAPAIDFLNPGMYWYGWTATAALGAIMVGLVTALLLERWAREAWPGWACVVAVAAAVACVYLTVPWF